MKYLFLFANFNVVVLGLSCSSPEMPAMQNPPPLPLAKLEALPDSVVPVSKVYAFPQINRQPICDDKGLCFKNPQLPLSSWRETVWASYFDDVWMFPQGPHAFHFDGIEWKWTQVPTKTYIRAAWGEKPTMDHARNLWVLSEDGQVFKLAGNDWQSIGLLRPPLSMPNSTGVSHAYFHSIQGRHSSDLWAAGQYGDVEGMYHFDGTNWSFVGANELGIGSVGKIWGMWASDKHVWSIMVGRLKTSNDDLVLLFIWDGTAWKRVTDPGIDGFTIRNWFPAQKEDIITGNSDSDVWIASTQNLYHYDGTSWSTINKTLPENQYIQTIRADQNQGLWLLTENGHSSEETSWHFDGTTFSNRLGGVQVDRFLTTTTGQDAWFLGKSDPNQPERTLFYWDGKKLQTHATDIFAYFDTFNQDKIQSSFPANALFGTDENNLWLVGNSFLPQQSRVIKWGPDGNHQFFETPLEITTGWSSGPNDVWVGGNAMALFHYNGSTWKEGLIQGKITPFLNGLSRLEAFDWDLIFSIWGTNPNNVWAVGSAGAILHYDGQIWTVVQTNNQPYYLYKIWGLDQDHIWAVGSKGTILFFDGKTWSPDARFENVATSSYNFMGFQAIQDAHGAITTFFLSGSEDYEVLKTDDQGKPTAHLYSKPLVLQGVEYQGKYSWNRIAPSIFSSESFSSAQVLAKSQDDFWISVGGDDSLYHYTPSYGSPHIWTKLGIGLLHSTPQGIWMAGTNGALLFSK